MVRIWTPQTVKKKINWFVNPRVRYFAQIWTITYAESYFKVSFFIPLACSVKAFEFDLTFFMASRSFALAGTFST